MRRWLTLVPLSLAARRALDHSIKAIRVAKLAIVAINKRELPDWPMGGPSTSGSPSIWARSYRDAFRTRYTEPAGSRRFLRSNNEQGFGYVPPPKKRSARMIAEMDARRQRLEEAWKLEAR